MATLVAENLAKAYKGRRVVEDVSLQVKSGEIVGLLGPNGAGKTTTFYMVVGIVPRDAGRIIIDDEDISILPLHARARRGIGYLPQEASIFRRLSVYDNLMGVLQIRDDLTEEQRQDRANELMEEFHIEHLRNSLGQALSGGERRRVEIARALAANPKFILLDEPFAGVDPISVIDIKKIIEHLRDSGLGVLITDHNVRETLAVGHVVNIDRFILQNAGSIQEILIDRAGAFIVQIGLRDFDAVQFALQNSTNHRGIPLRCCLNDGLRHQIHLLVINQTRVAQPGGHQDHRALALHRQRLQRNGIADCQPVRTKPLFLQRGVRLFNNLINVAFAVAEALRHTLHNLAQTRCQPAFIGSKIAIARTQRQPIFRPHGGHANDVDIKAHIRNQFAYDRQLLKVLFAKTGDVRLHQVEQFADNRGDTAEVARPAGTLQQRRESSCSVRG